MWRNYELFNKKRWFIMVINKDDVKEIIKNSILAPIDFNEEIQVYDVLYPIKNDMFLLFNVSVEGEDVYIGGTSIDNIKGGYIDLIDASIINLEEFLKIYVEEEL